MGGFAAWAWRADFVVAATAVDGGAAFATAVCGARVGAAGVATRDGVDGSIDAGGGDGVSSRPAPAFDAGSAFAVCVADGFATAGAAAGSGRGDVDATTFVSRGGTTGITAEAAGASAGARVTTTRSPLRHGA